MSVEDRRLVIDLACLTEDRTRAEQAALLRMAFTLDMEANRLTVTNRRSRTQPAYQTVMHVIGSWDPSEPCPPVELTERQQHAWLARVDEWQRTV